MAALKAYEEQSANDPNIMTALQCLKKRCSIPDTQRLYDSDTPVVGKLNSQPALGSTSLLASVMVLLMLAMLAVVFAVLFIPSQRRPDAGAELESCPE